MNQAIQMEENTGIVYLWLYLQDASHLSCLAAGHPMYHFGR